MVILFLLRFNRTRKKQLLNHPFFTTFKKIAPPNL